MKTKKHFLVSLFLVVMFSAFSLAVVSCKKEPEPTPPDYGEDGTYYFDAGHSEYQVTLKDGLATLWINGENESGVYVYDGANFTLTLDGASTASVATLSDNVLMLEYEGSAYRFLKKINYTVTYEANGGAAVQATTVLNGKTLAKPADPTKTGYVFIGWYVDADYKTPFVFNGTPITANTTLYARYTQELAGDNEYEITFMVDGQVYSTATTIEGVVCDMPTDPTKQDATFAGWWVSDFQNSEKPTYKYTNQVLSENTSLYAVWSTDAPLISVTATGIVWNSTVTNASYELTITAPNGAVLVDGNSVGTTSYEYDFSTRDAGEYTIQVKNKNNNTTSTAYYNNKALDRVSLFHVSDTSVLFYNAVENAQKYEIKINCGNDSHDHSKLDNGKSTYYNFSNCDMQEGGIAFTVTATATGYASSISETFYYSRDLGRVENLLIDGATGLASWKAVANATSYVVKVAQGEKVDTVNVGAETSFSVKGYVGEYELSVYPVAQGYNSSEAVSVTYNNTKLATPTNIVLRNKTLSWDTVTNATSYVVKIGNYTYPVDSASLALTNNHYDLGISDYEISVQAVGANGETSYYSDVLNVKLNSLENAVTYSKGVVSWSPVIYSYGYVVKVNDKEIGVNENVNFMPVELTKKGVNTISVGFYDDTSRLVWAEISVYAYAIEFDTRGGSAVDTQYKALGDPIDLVDSEKLGYDFSGWYNIPGGASTNGKLYTADSVCNGTAVLYAYWAPKAFTVTLMAYGEEVGTEVVYYEQEFVLPTVDSRDSTKVFYGWFAEENSQGMRYTNAQGQSIDVTGEIGGVWRVVSDRTLYAGWIDIITFTKIANRDAYMVEAGDAISVVTEITIPVRYGDDPETTDVDESLPVTEIPGSAFQSCKNLLVINIPDTIEYIASGLGGTYTGSAFQYCDNLQKINIYETEGTHDRVYYSVDGVLFYNNTIDITGGVELYMLPDGRTGPYSIPVGTQVIPTNALYSANISELVVPYTVNRIDSQAFSRSSLTVVTFSETPEPDDPNVEKTETPLVFGSKIFLGCTKLETVSLPARLSQLELDIFEGCTNLSNINIEESEGEVQYTSKDGMLCDGKGTTLLYCPKGRSGDVTIPSGVRYIGEGAFKDCKKIQNLTIPAYVEMIGKDAFNNCTAIESVVFEGAATDPALTIGECAFYNCTKLTELELPENLKTLGASAFGKTVNLKKVTVLSIFTPAAENDDSGLDFANGAFTPLSTETQKSYVEELYLGEGVYVKSIPGVFGTALKSLTVNENNPYYTSQDGVLYNKNVTALVYYPASRTDAYNMPDTVEEIGARVFENNKNIAQITIGQSVKTIGEYAFNNCTKLAQVVIDGGTTELSIGNYAFQSCTALESITLPARTRIIGDYAFAKCSNAKLTTIVIPEGVTTIGDYAFYQSTRLETVEIPSTVTKMGGYTVDSDENEELTSMMVFSGCSALKTIKVADKNTNFAVVDGVLYGKTDGTITDLFMSPLQNGGDQGVVDIPKTVTKIWSDAFNGNEQIKKIMFSEGLEENATLEIGDKVFYKCINLQSVELPIGVKTIGANMFEECVALENVYIPYTVETIAVNAFKNCESLLTVTFGEVPDGVEAANVPNLVIGDTTQSLTYTSNAANFTVFSGCDNLSELEFPARLSKIGYAAFYKLDSLTTVSFETEGSRLTEIGSQAFLGTSVGGELELPEGLEKIGWSAFSGLKGVTELTLPSTLTEINSSAFYSMSALETIIIPEKFNFTEIKQSMFQSCTSLKAMMTAEALEAAYKAVEGTDDEPELVVQLPEGITTIGLAVFASCTSMEKVILPKSIQVVGQRAFEYAKSLETIEFLEDSNLSTIKPSAFVASGITSFTFPNTVDNKAITLDGVEDEYDYIFRQCKQLKEVHLSAAVVNVDMLFGGCYSIEKITVDPNNKNFALDELQPYVTNTDGTAIRYAYNELKMTNGVFEIPEGIETIGASSFANQISLKELVIPAAVTEIGDYAFQGCINLEKITFESNSQLRSIGQYAFEQCISLKSIEVPESVEAIGQYAFSGCASLMTATINGAPTTVSQYKSYSTSKTATFKSYIFADCTALTTFTAPKLTSVGPYMFDGCTSLVNVSLPEVTMVEASAFVDCTALKSVSMPKATDFVTRELTIATGAITNKSIASNVFAGCTSLTTVDLSSVQVLGNYTFEGCTSLVSISLPELLELGNYGFKNCTALSEVNLPKLTTLGEYAFGGSTKPNTTNPLCASLTNISLPELQYIGQGAFQNCPALMTVSIPKVWATQSTTASTKTAQQGAIPANVFNGCAVLTTVDLGATNDQRDADKKLLSLGPWGTSGGRVFANCTSLQSINIPNTVIALGNYTFQNAGLTTIKLPDSLTHLAQWASKTATSATFKVSRTSSSSNTTSYAFDGCASLRRVDLNNVTSIGAYAFRNCTSLESVDKLSQVTGMAAYAFQNCSALQKADLSALTDNAKVGYGAFYGCSALSEVTLNSSLTKLSNYMFYQTTSLTSITMPTSLTDLGTYTFRYSGLESVSLPSGVKDIGTAVSTNAYTFADCENLKSVTFSGVTKIGGSAFYNCTLLDTIDLSKVTLVGNSAFSYCGALTTANLSAVSSASNMGPSVFAYCDKLANVTLNASLTQLKNYTFDGCTSLTTLTLPTSLTSIGQCAFRNSGLSSLTLPATLETIDASAFYGCAALTALDLPASLEKIGNSAFVNSGLTNLTIPANVSSIGTDPFNGCALTLLSVDSASEYYQVIDGILYSMSNAIVSVPAYVQGEVSLLEGVTLNANAFANNAKITKVIFPETLESIPTSAFDGATGLLSVTIPANVASIGNYAFRNCTNLVTVELLGEGLKVGTNAFEGCTALANLTIAEGVLELGNKAFYQTSQLTSVTIPNSLTKIGENTFAESGLTELNLPTAPETYLTVNKNAFAKTKIQSLVVPDADIRFSAASIFLESAIEELVIEGGTPTWGQSPFMSCVSLTKVTLAEGITEISQNMFQHCENLAEVEFPSTLTVINKFAFQGTPFTSLEIPEGVTTINDGAFKDCLSLESVTIPTTLTSWTNSFVNCTALTTVNLTEGLETIGSGVFDGCTALESVQLPQSLTTIGASAFKNSGLKSVTVPANVTTIGSEAFGTESLSTARIESTALTSAGASKKSAFLGTTALTVTFANGVTAIPQYMFSGCTSVSTVELPSTVAEIQKEAFSYSSITSIVIPGSVQTIGGSAFIGCESLTGVTLNEGLKLISSKAFSGSGVTSIEVPATVTEIDQYAFQYCESLRSFTMRDGSETVVMSFGVLDGCVNLATLELSSNLAAVGQFVFRNCTSVKSVVIPKDCALNGLTGAIFSGWTNMQTVYFENSAYDLLSVEYTHSGTFNLTSSYGIDMFKGCGAQLVFDYVAPNA